MRRLYLVILPVVTYSNINSHESKPPEVKVGDVLEIGLPDAPIYKHIDLPRPNFDFKKSGVTNYKKVEGNKVVATSLIEKRTVHYW